MDERRHGSAVSTTLCFATWRQIASTQDGVITRRQLRTAGLSDSGISRLAAAGELSAAVRGVFLVGGAPWTYRAQLWAALLATSGVLGFATAAHLWGIEPARPVPIDVVVDRHIAVPYGCRVHRVFVPSSAVTVHDGLRVTTRRQTLLDHLGTLEGEAALTLADRAVQRGWLRPVDIGRHCADFPGRRGNAVLRALYAQLGDGAAAASERRLHGILRRAGIRGWIPNHPVWHAGDLVAVVDVALPDPRLAVEVDGLAYHADSARFQRDRQRQNDLVALGWTVLRFTWADLTQRPHYVGAAVRMQVTRAG